MALRTTADDPAPVRTVARLLTEYVGRLSAIWVEGQVAGLQRRGGRCYLTLRDPSVEMSVQASVSTSLVDRCTPPLVEGARVVVRGQFSYWAGRGSLQLEITEIRPVGLGALLQQLEHRRQVLVAEGLTDPRRKRALPFLPRRVAVVTGRDSAAMRDVVENGTRRWPGVLFDVREVTVQGPRAVAEVGDAVKAADADPEVDVIVIARGGGSVEDLLPFSDEGLCRLVAACVTPVVSAIGHEQDSPLLDLVADVRASTPTDAAKIVVPDVAEQRTLVDGLRQRARRVVRAMVDRETDRVDALRSRPVLADPAGMLDRQADDVRAQRDRLRRTLDARLAHASTDLAGQLARVRALSPTATLARGFAVVQRDDDGVVVRSPDDAPGGTLLLIRTADGELGAEAL